MIAAVIPMDSPERESTPLQRGADSTTTTVATNDVDNSNASFDRLRAARYLVQESVDILTLLDIAAQTGFCPTRALLNRLTLMRDHTDAMASQIEHEELAGAGAR